MTTITDFAAVHAALQPYALATPSAAEAYSLTRMRRLMDALGDPQNLLKIIHVAGTSGKTSTSYYVAALLRQAGQRVGLTVSPHLDEINERLQIDLVPVPEPEFCAALSEFLTRIKILNVTPTFFELLIAFAYWYFARQKVDYAVVEVGLGGLLDSTNVCDRADKLCVITDIGLDHTQILGTDLPSIAAQKAGIIQPGNAVVCFNQSAAVDAVIAKQTANAGGQLLHYNYSAPKKSKLPAFQQRNWQLAAHAFTYIQQRDSLPKLSQAQWQTSQTTYIPGLMYIMMHAGKTIILDGAHNPQKMQTLITSLQSLYPNQAVAALVAVKTTKDVLAALEPIIDYAATTIATEFESGYGQSLPSSSAATIKDNFTKPVVAMADLPTALAALLKRPEPVLIITGSLYLVQQTKALLKRL